MENVIVVQIKQEEVNKKIPNPPLDRILVEGHIRKCPKCNSTAHKSGFLGLFGRIVCDNIKCSKSEKQE